jgi:hypothetical protein
MIIGIIARFFSIKKNKRVPLQHQQETATPPQQQLVRSKTTTSPFSNSMHIYFFI